MRCSIARTDRFRHVPADHAPGYQDNGRTFLNAATLLAELATEDESYGTAIGLLAVHAAISHADSVAIARGQRKSVSGSHDSAEQLLVAVLGDDFPATERRRFLRIISQKDAMAYQGDYVPLDDARRLLQLAQRFARWAEGMLAAGR